MYIVYHIASTVEFKRFDNEGGAKRSRTCANRRAGSVAYAYADAETYRTKVVTKKVVKNLMSGKDVVIDSNTPIYCDPSSETYWSM